MGQSAFIRFVQGSTVPSLTLDELKEQLIYYRDQLAQTGQQLDWKYDEVCFPYTIETKPEGDGRWFYLKGKYRHYESIVFGIGKEQVGEEERHHVQVVLPDGHTHGDKNKGNELCKYLAKHLKAELQLFNGRVMYFNPRK